jgi:MoxR-like ATPase
VRLVVATRQPGESGLSELTPYIAVGVSPRATLGLVAAGRALALLRGRAYLLPQDVFDVGTEVLRHRIVLTYDALAEDVTADMLVNRVLATVPAPRVTPRDASTGIGTSTAIAPGGIGATGVGTAPPPPAAGMAPAPSSSPAPEDPTERTA